MRHTNIYVINTLNYPDHEAIKTITYFRLTTGAHFQTHLLECGPVLGVYGHAVGLQSQKVIGESAQHFAEVVVVLFGKRRGGSVSRELRHNKWPHASRADLLIHMIEALILLYIYMYIINRIYANITRST